MNELINFIATRCDFEIFIQQLYLCSRLIYGQKFSFFPNFSRKYSASILASVLASIQISIEKKDETNHNDWPDRPVKIQTQ